MILFSTHTFLACKCSNGLEIWRPGFYSALALVYRILGRSLSISRTVPSRGLVIFIPSARQLHDPTSEPFYLLYPLPKMLSCPERNYMCIYPWNYKPTSRNLLLRYTSTNTKPHIHKVTCYVILYRFYKIPKF